MANNKLQLYIRSGAAQGSIEQTLKDRADDFTTSLLTVINGNPVLQECDPQDVVRTALKAASMRLPIDPNLGLAYIIPYRNKKKQKVQKSRPDGSTITVWEESHVYEPQLQIGWKGFVQLALRTRQYKTINVTDVRAGEYQGEDFLTGAIRFQWNPDREARKKLDTIGYVAYFKLHDGFEKVLYMTVDELEAHAKQYSQNYQKYGTGKWKDDKPAMSKKTVVKLLLSKWGPQSTELQMAFRADQAAMTEDDDYDYLDNKKEPVDKEQRSEPPFTKPSVNENGAPIEGEVVDPPAPSDVDQTPARPTEAEAPQAPPKSPEPPQQTVKEKAQEWVAKHKTKSNGQKAKTDGK